MSDLLTRIIKILPWRRREPSLQEVVADVVVSRIATNLIDKPNMELSEAGFRWALIFALKQYWPDIDSDTAVRWLQEYIGAPYGTQGYAWTASAANDVAREYAEQFGEKP